MKSLHFISFILVVIGALNWGLVGIGSFVGADWNIVHLILGSWPTLENIVYVLVGIAALMMAFTHKRDCRECMPQGM